MSQTVDPSFLQRDAYPHHLTLQTQFGDMDVFGHVNNLAIARFYESARARMQLVLFGDTPVFSPQAPYMTVVADMRLRFLAECNFPAPVEVGSGLGRIGRSSYWFHQALFQNGVCLGTSEAVLVFMAHGQSTPVPDAVRQQMQGLTMRTPAAL